MKISFLVLSSTMKQMQSDFHPLLWGRKFQQWCRDTTWVKFSLTFITNVFLLKVWICEFLMQGAVIWMKNGIGRKNLTDHFLVSWNRVTIIVKS